MKDKIDLRKKRHIHFIGIGGIGMSGAAHILSELGHKVSGSDLKDSRLLEKLRSRGTEVFIGHNASNLKKGTDLVVYSPCIRESNPEILKAKSSKIPIVHRHEILKALMRGKKGIAVTGAHGKGTTTALIGTILLKAGLDPTIVVGAEVADFGGNARLGKGDFFVMEADESDGSFAELEPYYAVITNIDKEHLEHYKNIDNIIKANRRFIERIKEEGRLFCPGGDKFVSKLLEGYMKGYKTFGLSREADIYATDIRTEMLTTTFRCVYGTREFGTFKLSLPGPHNVFNALAAISVALEIGIEASIIGEALARCKGASRRFEVKGQFRNILVIEDYAHHPTEIEAALRVCRGWNRPRIISIFQPHRFSRTKLLANDFARVFMLTDELILTDVYAAHEDSLEGAGSESILDIMKKCGRGRARLLSKEKIVEYLEPRVKEGDVILVLGAGDINDITTGLLGMLRAKAEADERVEATS